LKLILLSHGSPLINPGAQKRDLGRRPFGAARAKQWSRSKPAILLKGRDTGAAAVAGQSDNPSSSRLVAGPRKPDLVMPKNGTKMDGGPSLAFCAPGLIRDCRGTAKSTSKNPSPPISTLTRGRFLMAPISSPRPHPWQLFPATQINQPRVVPDHIFARRGLSRLHWPSPHDRAAQSISLRSCHRKAPTSSSASSWPTTAPMPITG